MNIENESPLVSINILSWNSKDKLGYVLNRVEKLSYKNIEIIVVDNDSIDGSPEMVEKEFPKVKLCRLKKNIGIAGWNEGFKIARGDYILVLDHDSFPDKNAIQWCIEKFKNNPKLGLAAFKIVNYYDNSIRQSEEYERYVNKETSVVGSFVKRFVGGGAFIRKKVVNITGGYSNPNIS
ncbi:MAG: glycosyltransferase [Deltaproteobacteria bacterium]|uniref:glycosyltransferase family 2 protein n=1 Tax=Desulfobacula sp. TaxID=2593537 RepID=UPI0019C3B674|nr:glycosyltransferase [Candidatus Desulfobacula maris]MBL6995853.1 glycosyltransferase [Desulfobacula sp.]